MLVRDHAPLVGYGYIDHNFPQRERFKDYP